MSSVNYLREQFSRLQTEEERNRFCHKIVAAEYWSRSEEQMNSLPETFLNDLLDNLRDALSAEGRVDVYDNFAEIVGKLYGWSRWDIMIRSRCIGKPEFANLLSRIYQDKEKMETLVRLLRG
jgi:hypothetical protein